MYAFIFARGGSKGIPNKNITVFNGTTLLGHSIQILKSYFSESKIFVSSDSPAILKEACQHGVNSVLRPESLSTDESNEILSWRNMCEQLDLNETEPFLVAPVTSPFRTTGDIIKGKELWESSKYDIVMTKTSSSRNPYLNMVTYNNNGLLRPLSYKDKLYRRQDSPPFWDILTILYITNYAYIRNTCDLLSGDVGWLEIPKERSIDIDTPCDLKYAKMLLNINKQIND
tara:strand:+ start:21847 stop:22533 length:687 start_codon:yes stop_codon:yes gene_type:complete